MNRNSISKTIFAFLILVSIFLLAEKVVFCQSSPYSYTKGDEASSSDTNTKEKIENITISDKFNQTSQVQILVASNIERLDTELILSGPIWELPE